MRLAHERGMYVLLDECYVYLNFEGEPVSGASFTDCKEHVVVLGSLSKTYAMTGWRAGFALGPKPMIAAMSKLQSQSTIERGEHGAAGVDCGADGHAGLRGGDAGGLHQAARPGAGRASRRFRG